MEGGRPRRAVQPGAVAPGRREPSVLSRGTSGRHPGRRNRHGYALGHGVSGVSAVVELRPRPGILRRGRGLVRPDAGNPCGSLGSHRGAQVRGEAGHAATDSRRKSIGRGRFSMGWRRVGGVWRFRSRRVLIPETTCLDAAPCQRPAGRRTRTLCGVAVIKQPFQLSTSSTSKKVAILSNNADRPGCGSRTRRRP